MNDKNEATVRQMLEMWAAPDPDAMAGLFREDGVYFNVPTDKPFRGREAIHQWLSSVANHLTRIDVELIHIASRDEWVLSERVDKHVVGDRTLVLPVMSICQVQEGRIAIWRDYYDQKTVESWGPV